MDSHQAKRIRVSQAEDENPTPIPQNDLTLPHDIIAQIIANSNNATLSRWMRVSSEYNRIAVPHLYEYINIGPGDRSPFAATTENMLRRPIQRKSAEKMSNLGMVRGVTISLPYVDDGDWDLPRRGLSVDWLRLSERRCQEYMDDVCHPIVTGDALDQLQPEKLIVRTSYSQPTLDFDYYPKRILVFCPAFPPIATTKIPEEVVYIFWSKNPSEPSLICNDEAVDELCGDLWRQWMDPSSPKVTFVNAGGIDQKRFDPPFDSANPTYVEKETAFKAIFNDQFGLPGPSRGRWRALDERVTLPACTWLSMKEYLTTHDWTGEFTAEEVEPWLREEVEEVSEGDA